MQKAEVSGRAKRKAATRTTGTGLPARSLRTILQELGNRSCDEATLPGRPDHTFAIIAQPNLLQAEAFQRLGVEASKMIPVPPHPRNRLTAWQIKGFCAQDAGARTLSAACCTFAQT